MLLYDFKVIEKKWQNYWQQEGLFSMPTDHSREKFYVLGMWAYPSGDAHMGHVRNYTITDVIARYKKMKGFNVLHPTGWDAFGLPTENAAFKRKIEPSEWNKVCTQRMEEQFKSLGLSYDWDKIIDTSDSLYYHWTQWLLIRLWERGILYRGKKEVNWCTGCLTVLANEQVEEECCERCKSPVIQKEMEQWFLKMSTYAELLLEDLKLLKEWPQYVVTMQRNWIEGKGDSYNLRDWCISRQRYWGAPLPFVICEKCGVQPVPDSELPVLLPTGADITPGWPPPLARIPSFINSVCPKCQGKAERATDVLDTFVFSAWYFLRFTDPQNIEVVFEPEKEKYWMPVDLYVGGVEHATVHLIYARFFHKALYDLGLVNEPEPFKRLFVQGMIRLKGEKMSKSKGNIVSPVEIVNQYGADALRTFILFVGPPEQDVDWNDQGIKGCRRFLGRVFNTITSVYPHYVKDWKEQIKGHNFEEKDYLFRSRIHQCISKVTNTLENDLHFNTAIATLMQLINEFESYLSSQPNALVLSEAAEYLTLLIYPFAPHLAEELWHCLGNNSSVGQQTWPESNPKFLKKEEILIVIQVNGKKKGVLLLDAKENLSEDEVTDRAKQTLALSGTHLEVIKIIYVPKRIINFVVKR